MRRRAKAIFLALIIGPTASSVVSGASYDELKAAALKQCQTIDAGAYQTGLLFNPKGYRSFYLRSECLQKTAAEFRDESLCALVKERPSLLSSSWGYSPPQCTKLVREGIASGERALTEMKDSYRRGALQPSDFRVERNGNGRDFDLIPSFAGSYAHGYVLRFEILAPDNKFALLHSAGYYLDGRSDLRIFLRQEEIRSRFGAFIPGQLYTVRATSILDIGSGGPAGRWSEPFIERIFPLRERSQSLDREVRF
jgi:hypothetical protein